MINVFKAMNFKDVNFEKVRSTLIQDDKEHRARQEDFMRRGGRADTAVSWRQVTAAASAARAPSVVAAGTPLNTATSASTTAATATAPASLAAAVVVPTAVATTAVATAGAALAAATAVAQTRSRRHLSTISAPSSTHASATLATPPPLPTSTHKKLDYVLVCESCDEIA